jgi:hypothetical protein
MSSTMGYAVTFAEEGCGKQVRVAQMQTAPYRYGAVAVSDSGLRRNDEL